MTTEEKDAEIERLKGELAEAIRELIDERETWTVEIASEQLGGNVIKEHYARGRKNGIDVAISLLQKHTPPNCGSAAAGESPSHSGGGERKAGLKLIQVCDKCFQASCWQGIFMCDEAQNAGTVYKTIDELKVLSRENPCYWKTDKQLAQESNENQKASFNIQRGPNRR